jgi:C4-dicarboxylate transporter DctM subunit
MFALVCGSSVATVVAIGSIVLPEMVKRGYRCISAPGVITVAARSASDAAVDPEGDLRGVDQHSIGALFVAGLLPGTLLTFMLCTVTWYIARKNNYPRMPKATWGESVSAFRDSVWGLMLVVIIIGGIYTASSPRPRRPR